MPSTEVDARYLAEGFHAAFRKGIDHPKAAAVHSAIRELPEDVYLEAIRWVIYCMGWKDTSK